MKILKIVLALLGGLLIGLAWILQDGVPILESRLINGALFLVFGFAGLYWCKQRISWKSFVFLQIPFLGLMTWNFARLQPANYAAWIWLWSAAFLVILALLAIVEVRLSSDVDRQGATTNAGQVRDGNADEATPMKPSD